MLKQIYSAVSVWLGWFGVTAGVISVISVLVRGFDVGVQPVLADFINFYRALVRPIYEALSRIPLPFAITPSFVEWVALYAALFGLSLRAEFSPARHDLWKHLAPSPVRFLYRQVPNLPKMWKQLIKCALLIPFFTMQPVIDMVPYYRRLGRLKDGRSGVADDDGTQTARHEKMWTAAILQNILMFATFPVAVILFFIVNEYGFG